ncbi:hypothetical protein [Sediminibacillus albus]|uniref:hypothetical protein n=1 Tax=Sediminibacillus albus TaxID=407036 RepID=UPI000B80B534|nr:hypothetical protein [Sediminibacillus albus]
MFALFVALFIPPYIGEAFQKTLATGMYAVSYNRDISNCQFEKTDNSTLQGTCELYFENYSSNDVEFSVSFYERFDDFLPTVSLMNNDAPFQVVLNGGESRKVPLKTNIDITQMDGYIEQANTLGIGIIIKSNGNRRGL